MVLRIGFNPNGFVEIGGENWFERLHVFYHPEGEMSWSILLSLQRVYFGQKPPWKGL